MRAGIPLWEHWPTCNDVSALQCLRLFWRRSAYIGDLDVASSEHCSGVKGLGICVLLLYSPSAMSDSLWPHGLQHARLPGLHHLPELAQTHVHRVNDASNHLILCHPLLLLSLIFPSIGVFSNESALHIRWPNYWSFSISPFNGYSGLIPFRTDWLDLLAVQGTLESLLQHHSSKATILQHSAFFMVQLSHPYITTGKTIASTLQTFVNLWSWVVH